MVQASLANNDLLHDLVESSGVLPRSYFERSTQCHPLAVRPLKCLMVSRDPKSGNFTICVSRIGFNPAGGVTSLPGGGEHAVIHTRPRMKLSRH
jgi:hypothetical protein